MLKNPELIQEFYELNKDKYPNLNLEQMKDICFTPWSCLKQEMENGDLKEVRFKYFGTFQVYKGRAEKLLINLEERYEQKAIEELEYQNLKAILEKRLKKENV